MGWFAHRNYLKHLSTLVFFMAPKTCKKRQTLALNFNPKPLFHYFALRNTLAKSKTKQIHIFKNVDINYDVTENIVKEIVKEFCL